MLLHLAFLPALIAVITGVNNPPDINVNVKVAVETPAQVSGTSISERRELTQRNRVRDRNPIPPKYCTPFQFSQCDVQSQQGNVIGIKDMRTAWDCSRVCERDSKCNSWMFSKDGVKDITGKCWLVKTQAGQTVKELCNMHQGSVLPFSLVDQLESCLEEIKFYQRRCKVGECIPLKPQYKLGHENAQSESDCKFKCEVKITTEPQNNCSNYSWNKETKQCTLFSIRENAAANGLGMARDAADEWDCRMIAGTKNMTKNEVDNCFNFRAHRKIWKKCKAHWEHIEGSPKMDFATCKANCEDTCGCTAVNYNTVHAAEKSNLVKKICTKVKVVFLESAHQEE